MPTASISETASVAPGQIAVERRDGRTVYTWSWHKPWSWTSIVNTCAVLAAYLIFDAARRSWTRREAEVSLLAAVMCVALLTGIEYLRHRYGRKQGRLEVSSDGIRIGRGWRGRRMTEAIPLDKVMGAKPFGAALGMPSVVLMVPGHSGGLATPCLPTREDAQWLANAIEAEIRARGYEL